MSDRVNRALAALLGALLLVGGTLALLMGVGVFGDRRSQQAIFDSTMLHWWNNGRTWSFVVLGAAGLIVFVVGLFLATREWRRNDGRSRTDTILFPSGENARGRTTLRTPALSHSLESELSSTAQVGKSFVGLFGRAPDVEMRSVLEVSDDADISELSRAVDDVLGRMESTVGFRPDPVQVTLRFRGGSAPRVLE